MIRRLIVAAFLGISFFSMTSAISAPHFQLDVLRDPGYVCFQDSVTFNKYAYLSDTAIARLDDNNIYRKYSTFGLMDVSIFDVGAAYIVTMSVEPQNVPFGGDVTLDITVSEELRNWSVLIDTIEQFNITYNAQHLYVVYTPTLSGERTFVLNADLIDMGGNVRNSLVTFNLFCDDGTNLIQTQVSDDIYSEVHVGRQKAPVMSFDLMAPRATNVWVGVTINIDQKDGIAMWDKLYLVNMSDGSIVASSTIQSTAQDLYLPLEKEIILTNVNTRFEFQVDITANASRAGATFNVRVVDFLSRQVSGLQTPIHTTGSMMSDTIEIIPETQPIVYRAKLDPFLPETSRITPDIRIEMILGQVNQIVYSIRDLTSGNQSITVNMPFEATLISNNRYYMSNNPFNSVQLTHNHQYMVYFRVSGTGTSSLAHTNAFIIDTTPPLQPASLIAEEVIHSDPGSTPQNSTWVRYTVNTIPWSSLEFESGIKGFKIMRKSSSSPVWQQVLTSNVTTGNAYKLERLEEKNVVYYYSIAIQNNAGLWSDMSLPKEVDLRTNAGLIDTLFNSPNPFDSRIQNTTIYYSLRSNADVDLYLYDMYGYLVRKWHFASGTPLRGEKQNELTWDATNLLGDKVSMGGYIVILKATDAIGNTMQRKYSIGVMR